MFAWLREDVRTVLERDPAAAHAWQVVLFYPGLHAVWLHRLAAVCWRRRWLVPAYAIAALARWLTGIEIHPGATLGRRFFIDHGMGVVIGETAEVDDDVTLYHGVTLGGVSLAKGKRHPTIERGVVIGAGAKVLGAITIGRNTRVGANAVVVKDVPPDRVVVGVPGKPLTREHPAPARVDLEHNELPDTVSAQLDALRRRVEQLEAALEYEPHP